MLLYVMVSVLGTSNDYSQREACCADEAGQDTVGRVRSVLVQPGMLKKLLGSKSPIPVRSACCALIALLCKR